MVTHEQILAEIRAKLKVYDQQGLLDEISISNWIKECIKDFGGNILDEYHTTLLVQNGRTKLPDNFWALKACVKCEQEGYHEAKTKKHAQTIRSYYEWTEISDYYNYLEGKPCEDDCDAKYITETLYFEVPDKSYTFYYNQPKILNLVPHIYRVRCDNDCPNLNANSEYDISIDERHNYLTTNFNDGFVSLWYRGLPQDEYGKLVIPETSGDKLKNYILYFVIVRKLQDLLLSEDDPNIFNKLQVFQPLADQYFYQAKSESISRGISGWRTRIVNNNRRHVMKFENLFRNL